MLLAFATAYNYWILSIVCYVGAFVGDAVDGHVARAFKQGSCGSSSSLPRQ
jgi:phosphatidylglycerophosphate synthase